MSKCIFEKSLENELADYLQSELGIKKQKTLKVIASLNELVGQGQDLPFCKWADDMEWNAPRIKKLIEICMSKDN